MYQTIGGVFMVDQQQKLIVSPYMEIYELVVPRDNLLRQIKESDKGISRLRICL